MTKPQHLGFKQELRTHSWMIRKYQIEIPTVFARKQKVLCNILLRLDRNFPELVLPQKPAYLPLGIDTCEKVLECWGKTGSEQLFLLVAPFNFTLWQSPVQSNLHHGLSKTMAMPLFNAERSGICKIPCFHLLSICYGVRTAACPPRHPDVPPLAAQASCHLPPLFWEMISATVAWASHSHCSSSPDFISSHLSLWHVWASFHSTPRRIFHFLLEKSQS